MFTFPVGFWNPISQGIPTPPPTDPHANNVVLFLKGDGTNGSTNIVDSSLSPKTISVFGNAQISTVQSKYGGSSIFFDGSGDYLQVANNVDFDFGNGDFTIEFWSRLEGIDLFYPTHFSMRTENTNPGNKLLSSYGDGGYGFRLNYKFPDGESLFSSSFTQSTDNNQWVHFALCRSGSTARAFRNGILDYSVNGNTSITGCFLTIGQFNNPFGDFFFKGWMSHFRITKGIARYTANFNPETDTFLN
jgi:hypothetical protein